MKPIRLPQISPIQRKGFFRFLLFIAFVPRADAATFKTEANVMVELTFKAQRNYKDPFNEVTLDAIVVDPQKGELRVPAFWAGTNLWKIRYASPLVGTHHFRTVCSEPRDKGLHGVSGKIEVQPYRGQNPLFTRGPLRASPNHRYLEHADGAPFFWLGDTWWMGLCHRLHWPDEFKQLTADRKEKGFNVIQLVAGLYPDMPPFDPRGANEAGFPWQTNYGSIRPEYFNAADQRIQYLVDQGLTPCIVGAWGYFLPWMGPEKMNQHWRYLIARYGALPVVWCAGGEANLPYYLTKGFPFDDRSQVKSWTEVMRYIHQTDPFHRLVTIHPTGINRLSARNATDDTSLLDIDMLQTPHGYADAVPPTVKTIRESYADKPIMPVINGEASYEMLMDKIPAEWPRAMFWICMLNGAAGHTYGANGIWQCNRRGQPHGPSPNGAKDSVGYGKISWDEAMHLPGSTQLALGKKLFTQYEWQRFTPHREWAEFADDGQLALEGSPWIWYDEGNPAVDAPAQKRFFRKTFSLPESGTISSARMFVSADDWFAAWLNGTKLGANGNWKAGKRFGSLSHLLKPGKNVLAIVAENKPADVPANPAGLLARLEVRFADGQVSQWMSDATWRCTNSPAVDWITSDFDDSAWSQAKVTATYGDGPWGKIGTQSEFDGPQSAGIPDRVRVIWVPRTEAIILHDLGSPPWTASYFDPVTGAKTALPFTQPSHDSSWTCPPPIGHDHDWVLILEAKTGVKVSSPREAGR